MKSFIILLFAVGFLSKAAPAEGVKVPSVGSVWKSTSVSLSVPEDGSTPRRRSEVFKVDRLESGRPVFVGNMYGHEGELIESSVGTVIYALECKQDVPVEMLMPPALPNQCIWHVCYAPPVGETFSRPMVIYAPIFGCQKQEGEYSFTSIRIEGEGGGAVTIGNAEITRRGARMGSWESHIKAGIGQVFAKSSDKVTRYDQVEVFLVPYQTGSVVSSTPAAPAPSQ